MLKTKLKDIYCLSFVESVDTLKAIDSENADVVKIFNEYENPSEHIKEISHRTGVSIYRIHELVRIKAIHNNNGDVIDLIGHTRSRMRVPDDQIISLVESGLSCADIARKVGLDDFTIWKQLQDLGYRYNRRLGRWAKTV